MELAQYFSICAGAVEMCKLAFKWKVLLVAVLYLMGTFINGFLSDMYYRELSNWMFFMLYMLQIVPYVLIGLLTGGGKDRLREEKVTLRILAVVIVILLALPFLLWAVEIRPLIQLSLFVMKGYSVAFLGLALGYILPSAVKK